MPGQPNFITPVASTFFVIVCFMLTLKIKTKIPAKLYGPMAIWAAYLVIYAIIAFWYDFKVGSAVLLLRFVQFLVPVVVIKLLKSFKELENILQYILILIVLLVPISFYAIVYGNESLPDIFKPVKAIQELDRDKRAGYDICAGIFSNGAIMAFSVLSYYYIFLSAALGKTKRKWLYLIGALLAIFIMYSTVRRSTLYFSAIGLLIYIYLYSKKGIGYILFLSVIIFIMFLSSPEIPNSAHNIERTGLRARSGIFIEGVGEADKRMKSVAIERVVFWANKKPFGTFLGYAGNEGGFGKVPNSGEIGAIETGGAQLIAETGIMGLFIYIGVFIWVWYEIFKKRKKSKYSDSITMLFVGNSCLALLYLLQMVSIQFGMYVPHIMFWANPGIAWVLIRYEKIDMK